MTTAPPEPAPRSDGELLRLFLMSRDRSSLTEIVTRHAALVRGVCQRLLGNTPDAEDAFQATFLVLVRRGDRIHQPQSLAAWLYGVAHRIAQRLRRQRSRAVVRVQEEHLMIDTDALAELATRHDVALFDAELARLPEKYRSPIVLHHLEGKTQREIATELKLTEGAVDGLLKRGRNELRVRLARRGVVFGMTVAVLEQSQHAIAATPSQSLIDATVHSILSFDPVLNHEIPRSPSVRLAQQEITTMGIYHAGKVTGWAVAASLLLGTAGVGISTVRHDLSFGPPGLIASELDVLEAPADAVIALASVTIEGTGDGIRVDASEEAPSKNVDNLGSEFKVLKPADFRPLRLSEDPIIKALDRQAQVSFVDTSLTDAMQMISDLHKFNIIVPNKHGNGLTTDVTVNLELSGVPLRNVLKLILEPLSLDYIIQDGVLKITSRQAADDYHEMRIYHVDGFGEETEAMVKDTVGGQWKKPGSEGPGGTIQWTPNGLIVRHNQRTHLAVEQFLNQLQPANAGQKPLTGTISSDGLSGTRPAFGSVTMSGNVTMSNNTLTAELPSSTVQYRRISANEKRLYQALHDKTEVSFVDSTLRDAMDFIEDRHKIEILINQQEIAEEGLSSDTPVTLELSGAELHNVLDLMLEPHNLDYVIKNEVLMITTRDQAKSPKYQELRIYNIDELPPLIDKAHRDKDDANQKIETAIKQAVGGEGEWASEGGTSTLQWTPAGLIVRTNQRMHAEIEEFLQQLRRADGQGE